MSEKQLKIIDNTLTSYENLQNFNLDTSYASW